MKKYKSIGKLLAVSFFTAVIASACTEDAMDKVNKNPNNPQDAPAKFLITDLGVSTAFSTVGGDFSLYSSVYMEHETQPTLPGRSPQRRTDHCHDLQQCVDQRLRQYKECKDCNQQVSGRPIGKRQCSN